MTKDIWNSVFNPHRSNELLPFRLVLLCRTVPTVQSNPKDAVMLGRCALNTVLILPWVFPPWGDMPAMGLTWWIDSPVRLDAEEGVNNGRPSLQKGWDHVQPLWAEQLKQLETGTGEDSQYLEKNISHWKWIDVTGWWGSVEQCSTLIPRL